jgi:MYXO-CTERM domain-containing protein
VHWSGNMDEIQDFERDIRESFDGAGFMSDADYDARKDASGIFDPLSTPSAGASPELDALAAYITSFEHVGRSPFRNADGSFSKDAREGRKVFERAGCVPCHSGPDFTDSPLNVLHDVGTLLPTSGNRLGAALTGIDTPTLKGLWQTAPYLHDGRAATLYDVFAATQDHMGVVSNLSQIELDQLVRYLLELDDVPETVVMDEPMTGGARNGGSAGASNRDSASCVVGAPPSPGNAGVWLVLAALGFLRRRR